MTKKNLIKTYFQRKELLTTGNPEYQKHLNELFNFMKDADDASHDKSLQLFKTDEPEKAAIIAKQDGVIAGIEEVLFLAKKYSSLNIIYHATDEDEIGTGAPLLTIAGSSQELLTYERIFLNILGRMSGIATEANKLTKIFPTIAATRKTPWMLLDKKAVAVGSGLTHRLSLSDWPMIKDTHLAILKNQEKLSLEQTISQAIKNILSLPFFEIEVSTLDQAKTAIQTFGKNKQDNTAMALLLDNFDPDTAAQTIAVLKTYSVYQDILLEASGNITEENLPEWAATGVDIISLGSLTHSAPNFDVSMKII